MKEVKSLFRSRGLLHPTACVCVCVAKQLYVPRALAIEYTVSPQGHKF